MDANLEYLAVRVLVQDLLNGDVQRGLSLTECVSFAGTASVHGATGHREHLKTPRTHASPVELTLRERI